MDDLTDHEDCGLDHGAKAYHELEAEVERLRAYIEYLHLQPDSEGGRTWWDPTKATERGVAAEAEVERLQGDLGRAMDDLLRVGAEVERLQDARFMLETDVERLREDLETALETVTSRNREVERLRAELHDAETLIEDLRDGVKLNEEYRQHAERLRAALEHIADPHGFTQPARAENMRVYARAALAEEARDPKACVVQDLDRAGNYCTVHGWHPTLECFESERLGIARDALAKEKE
jgi:DNA repair exonuclease SbcCD ATPase subunit